MGNLYNPLKRSRPEDTDNSVFKMLRAITRACEECRHHSLKHQFRALLTPDCVIFNHEIAIDLMRLEGKPFLHIVDTHTHFQNAAVLMSISTGDIWNGYVKGWDSVCI